MNILLLAPRGTGHLIEFGWAVQSCTCKKEILYYGYCITTAFCLGVN